MKRVHHFLFNTDHETAGACVAWLEAMDITPTESTVEVDKRSNGTPYCVVDVYLPDGDDRPALLQRAIESVGQEPSASRRLEITYSVEDLASAAACKLSTGIDAKVQTGAIFGTKYDMTNACPECGIGRKQIGPLVAKRSQIPKRKPIVLSETSEVLFRADLHQAVLAAVPDAEESFGPVVERQTGLPIDYCQVVPRRTLPPMHAASTGIVIDDEPYQPPKPRRCTRCRRNGYFGTLQEPARPVYQLDRSTLWGLGPFLHTWEHWGFTGPIHSNRQIVDIAPPIVVVRQDVVRVLLEKKVRGIQRSLTPVTLIEA